MVVATPQGQGGGGQSGSIDAGEIVYTFDVEGAEGLGSSLVQNVELTNQLIENLETLEGRYGSTAERGKEKFEGLKLAAAGFFGFMVGNAESTRSALGAVGTALGTIVDSMSMAFMPLIVKGVDWLTKTASAIMDVTAGGQDMSSTFSRLGELLGEGLEWTVETGFEFVFDFTTKGLDALQEGISDAMADVPYLPEGLISHLIAGGIGMWVGRGLGRFAGKGLGRMIPGLSDEAVGLLARRGGTVGAGAAGLLYAGTQVAEQMGIGPGLANEGGGSGGGGTPAGAAGTVGGGGLAGDALIEAIQQQQGGQASAATGNPLLRGTPMGGGAAGEEMGAPTFELTEAPHVTSSVVVPIIQNVSVANKTEIQDTSIDRFNTGTSDTQATGEG